MVDETPSAARSQEIAASSTTPILPRYEWLRWAIRITGIILMLGGTIYLGVTASQLLTGNKPGDGLFLVIGSLIALGIGLFVLRIGYSMLRTINARTISSFSFVFALIYTFILIEILPSSGVLADHPALLYLLVFLYFGLSYWALKNILFRLLLPPELR